MSHSIGRRRIAVLLGGTSAEREVSLESGQAVAAALRARGHLVDTIDAAETPVRDVDWSQFCGSFIALHGTYGEDGGVQSDLDALGVLYSGSGAEASALAFDKLRAKLRFQAVGLPTPAWIPFTSNDRPEQIRQTALGLGWPLVVKPRRQGSSVGVSLVHDPAALAGAMKNCCRYDSGGILEAWLPGDEWTVAVIERTPLRPIRIDAAREFYDYTAKYEDDATRLQPADASADPRLVDSLRQLARDACACLATSGIARVDLRLDAVGRPALLEVNTVPGFTSHSLVPLAAEAAGISLGQLCEAAVLGTSFESLSQAG